ncbi:Bifunctional protein BirA [Anaerotruncus sp. 2789STDY5834896]|uniref:biotin--[biotin carboxyl-carrier protein] ligase n=1 Tax=uncultured Anaerotruncus sp. TaxID=905011 RepID=A0A1C6KAB9_9FIRM|nr:Bifunctional protein BirA [uncultured Anaerotruncus sp.]
MQVLDPNIQQFAQLDSTNTYLKKNAFSLPGGHCVLAHSQTAGRGRQGKIWQDAPGDTLSLSFLLRPVELATVSFLPLLCGLATGAAIQALCGADWRIKWPNDLLVGDKKVCGILCEGIAGPESAAVCGIGVNLGQKAEYFARRQLPYATSLLVESGKKLVPLTLAQQIVAQADALLVTASTQGAEPLLGQYRRRCATLGRQVRVLTDAGQQTGRAVDIMADGSLLVEIGGRRQIIRSGEASVRGLYGYV